MIIRRHDAVQYGMQRLSELEQRYGRPSHMLYAMHVLGYSVIADDFAESYWASLYEVYVAAVEQESMATARSGTSHDSPRGHGVIASGGFGEPPSFVS